MYMLLHFGLFKFYYRFLLGLVSERSGSRQTRSLSFPLPAPKTGGGRISIKASESHPLEIRDAARWSLFMVEESNYFNFEVQIQCVFKPFHIIPNPFIFPFSNVMKYGNPQKNTIRLKERPDFMC